MIFQNLGVQKWTPTHRARVGAWFHRLAGCRPSASLGNSYSLHSKCACPCRHYFLACFPFSSLSLTPPPPRRAVKKVLLLPASLGWRAGLATASLVGGGWRPIAASLSSEAREPAMELDFRFPSADINTVYLSSYLGKGEVAGHRCDCSCQVQHVWANLYRCTTSGSSHVCDQNCNQRIIYDNHSTLCRVSGRIFPLTALEQEAIRGVRRKRDAESSDSSPLKRCRDMVKNAASFEAPFRQRVLPIPTFMDIN